MDVLSREIAIFTYCPNSKILRNIMYLEFRSCVIVSPSEISGEDYWDTAAPARNDTTIAEKLCELAFKLGLVIWAGQQQPSLGELSPPPTP